MITAKQARAVRLNPKQQLEQDVAFYLEEIEKKILARAGRATYVIIQKRLEEAELDLVKARLEENGFTVIVSDANDPEDCDTMPLRSLTIKWGE